eukprot:2819954-Pyramimonas_sp.AAC.1
MPLAGTRVPATQAVWRCDQFAQDLRRCFASLPRYASGGDCDFSGGVTNVCYAAALPPPEEVTLRQPAMSGLIQTDRMKALSLRVQAKEEAQRASSSTGT